MTNDLSSYINLPIHISGIPKELTPEMPSRDMTDEQLVAFYSEKYKDLDVAKFLLNNRNEMFYGLINLIKTEEFYLDIGCANGGHMAELYDRGIYGIGLDISISNILKGREQFPHLRFVHGFAEEIPFIDNYFDVVILSDVLEHCRDPYDVLYEGIRVTKKSLVLCVPVNENFFDESIYPFSLEGLENLLDSYKLQYHYYSVFGTEISRLDVIKKIPSSSLVLIRADITPETNSVVQKFSKQSEINRRNQNYHTIIEKDQWKKTSNIDRHETEIARFNLVSNLVEGSRILEMACGNGDGLSEIINRKLSAVGVDISYAGISHARDKYFQDIGENDINFCIMDSYETAFKENSFDTIIIPEVLEHIRSSRRIIQESIRIVRDGGRIIISVPEGLLIPWEGHLRFFFKDMLETELKQYSDHIEWHTLPFKKWIFCSFFVYKNRSPLSDGPKVDILMPTYNGKNTIQEAINSVLIQTYKNWNLIVVNDGGDDVSDIITRNNDSRITYIQSDHKGKSHALNIGIHQSQSPYITYLDDDDILYPLHIEGLITTAVNKKKDFVFCNWYEVDLNENREEISRNVEFFEDVTPIKLLFQNYINHKSVLHSRTLLEQVGYYDENLHILIDWDMIRRMAFVSYPYKVNSYTSEHRRYFFDGRIVNRITSLMITNPELVKDAIQRISLKNVVNFRDNSQLCEIVNYSIHNIHNYFTPILSREIVQLRNNILSLNEGNKTLLNTIISLQNYSEYVQSHYCALAGQYQAKGRENQSLQEYLEYVQSHYCALAGQYQAKSRENQFLQEYSEYVQSHYCALDEQYKEKERENQFLQEYSEYVQSHYCALDEQYKEKERENQSLREYVKYLQNHYCAIYGQLKEKITEILRLKDKVKELSWWMIWKRFSNEKM